MNKKLPSYLPDKDALLHLRLPFSWFLLPVFLFGLSQADAIDIYNAVIIFLVLHFFIYPGSNIYNSYMDRDEGSIGMLRKPPPVTRRLYYTSIIFDLTGLLLCTLSGWQLTLMMIIYIMVSKAYSWTGIRLKRFPYTGWLIVILFQGAYTYWMVNASAMKDFSLQWFNNRSLLAMLLTSGLIGGYYPVTQIYQHEEDLRRGDITISSRLGIQGTFLFTAVLFLLSCIIALIYFSSYYNMMHFIVFAVCLSPAVFYFIYWFFKVRKDVSLADYTHAMRMTFLSATCMNVCFLVLLWLNHG